MKSFKFSFQISLLIFKRRRFSSSHFLPFPCLLPLPPPPPRSLPSSSSSSPRRPLSSPSAFRCSAPNFSPFFQSPLSSSLFSPFGYVTRRLPQPLPLLPPPRGPTRSPARRECIRRESASARCEQRRGWGKRFAQAQGQVAPGTCSVNN